MTVEDAAKALTNEIMHDTAIAFIGSGKIQGVETIFIYLRNKKKAHSPIPEKYQGFPVALKIIKGY